MRLAAALLLATLLGWSAPAFAQQSDKAPPLATLFGGHFELVDHTGRTRSDTDFLGKYLLIYFGYTYCPDICPLNLEHMAGAMDELGPLADRVQPLFITVDPERDKAELLKGYVSAFHPRLIGLTGSQDQVAAALKAYRVHRRKVADPSPHADKGDYLVDHASITYLVGPDGKFVTLFPHNTDGERMAKVISGYLSGKPS